jgi:DNA-binding NarL/FixJ family response regulator
VAGVITVVLVDDHPLVTDGLRAAIDAEPDLRVVGVARTLAEARGALDTLHPDVAVVDLRLPDGSGFDLVDPLRATRWLMLSSFGTIQYVDATRAAGANGYWLKSATPDRIIAAIRTVAGGGLAFDPDLATRPSVAGRWHPLSPRELDVVRLSIAAASNDEIGRELGISKKTVESHITRLLERMGCATKHELAVRAIEEGWLDLPHR